jgi:hypothetical protein
VNKTISFINKEGNYFWSNGSSWGVCEISETKNGFDVNFSVKYGKIELEKFGIENFKTDEFKENVLLEENESLKLELEK